MRINMENKSTENKAPWWQPGLVLFMRLSGWIAGPVIAAVFIGKWLDRKYHSEPWLFLISVGVAFFFSMFGIIHDSMKEIKKIEEQAKREKKEKENKQNQKL
jgi:F0F1-type ATP synthase assembly protein I